MKKNKVCTADEAIALIKDGDMFVSTGFIMSMVPEELFVALERSFLETGHPRNLTLFNGAAACERTKDGGDAGFNLLAHEGLVTRSFSGFYGDAARFKAEILAGHVEAYNFPLGVMSHLLREYARGHNGELTKVGLKTYIDPRLEGGRWNDVPPSGEWIKVVEFLGEEYLYYSTPKPNFAILRGTTADEYGNITMEDEALYSLAKVAAMAVKQNGGTVVVQVKYLVPGGTMDSHDVAIPGIFVDKVVVCTNPAEYHRQTAGVLYNAVNAGHLKALESNTDPLPLGIHKIMGRRAAMELVPNSIVNLGMGNPENVSKIAAEEGCLDEMTLTVETGAIGGKPLSGEDFGATMNAWALVEEDRMFDLYDGGILDKTFLGLAETDVHGNVNVTKFKGTIMGTGGFTGLTQCTKDVVFVGTFTTGGLKVHCEDGKLIIDQEGKFVKFKNAVEQVTFSGDFANETGQNVLYITERAVLKLVPEGLQLIEVAPGIDIERDILPQMEFKPIIKDVKTMNPDIFKEGKIGLKEIIASKEK